MGLVPWFTLITIDKPWGQRWSVMGKVSACYFGTYQANSYDLIKKIIIELLFSNNYKSCNTFNLYYVLKIIHLFQFHLKFQCDHNQGKILVIKYNFAKMYPKSAHFEKKIQNQKNSISTFCMNYHLAMWFMELEFSWIHHGILSSFTFVIFFMDFPYFLPLFLFWIFCHFIIYLDHGPL